MSWRGGHRLSAGAGPAIRGLLLLFAAVAVALTWGPVNSAVPVAVATGLLGSALTDDGTPIRRSVATILLSVTTATVIVAVPAGAFPPVLIVVVMAVCLVAGAMWTLGGAAGLLGVGLGVVAVSAGAVPATAASTCATAGMVLGFGAAQVLLIPRWRYRDPDAAEAGEAVRYRRLADIARTMLAGDPDADPYPVGRGLPHRIATTLRAITAGRPDPHSLGAAADVLAALGDEGGRAAIHAADALRRLDDIRVPDATAAFWRLRGQLHEAVAARFGIDTPPARLHRHALSLLRHETRWESPVFRHALRLALGVGAALALVLLRQLPEGLWVPLTTLIVLRPGCARTYLTALQRIAGVAAGLTIATVITVSWHPGPAMLALLAIMFLAVGWVLRVRAPWAISLVLVGALAAVTRSPGSVADIVGDRLWAAAIGAAIAVWMYVLLPDPPRAKLYRGITEVLRAHVRYAAVVVRAFAGPATAATVARDEALAGATAARRAFDRVAATTRVTATTTAGLLDTARHEITGLAVAIAALDATSARELPADVLADAADEYAKALVGGGVPWRLDAAWLHSADEGLRLEGAVLAGDDQVASALAQIEAITRHTLALGEMAERVSGHLSYAYAVGDDVH